MHAYNVVVLDMASPSYSTSEMLNLFFEWNKNY